MDYIFIERDGDKNTIEEYKKNALAKDTKTLVQDYNKQCGLGVVGVHEQALCLVGMSLAFKERFCESPIYLEDNILGMKGEIEIVNNKLIYLKKEKKNELPGKRESKAK